MRHYYTKIGLMSHAMGRNMFFFVFFNENFHLQIIFLHHWISSCTKHVIKTYLKSNYFIVKIKKNKKNIETEVFCGICIPSGSAVMAAPWLCSLDILCPRRDSVHIRQEAECSHETKGHGEVEHQGVRPVRLGYLDHDQLLRLLQIHGTIRRDAARWGTVKSTGTHRTGGSLDAAIYVLVVICLTSGLSFFQ